MNARTHEEVFEATARNRHRIVDLLEGLGPEQWATPSLCAGWTVHHVAAHLLQPAYVGFVRFFLLALRHRGRTDEVVDHLARRIARRPPSEIVELLRAHADDRVDPARVGPWGPFAESCLHLRDIARPLGLPDDVPTADWVALLGYLTSRDVAPALVTTGRLDGLTLETTDAGFRHGSGPLVSGPAEALALAVAGRGPALDDLAGPGVAKLRTRVLPSG